MFLLIINLQVLLSFYYITCIHHMIQGGWPDVVLIMERGRDVRAFKIHPPDVVSIIEEGRDEQPFKIHSTDVVLNKGEGRHVQRFKITQLM